MKNKATCLLRPVFIGLIGFFISGTVAAADADFSTRFKEVRETSMGVYAIYMLTNDGSRDIDDVRLSFRLHDRNDGIVSSMASTDSTPGLVWLKAGESKQVGVPLDNVPEARKQLETDPGQFRLEVVVRELTYMD